MAKKQLYKIIFHNQDKIYEIFAKNVSQGALFGFVEVEEFVFGARSNLVVDPSEETLKTEFSHVTRTYIPMHAIIRIDAVDRQGGAKITQAGGAGPANVAPFPAYLRGGEKDKK